MLKEIRPDGTIVEHERLTFSDAREIVGGYVEYVHCPDGQAMLVNEDGHRLSLEINKTATVFYYGEYMRLYPQDSIVGTAIFGTRAEIDDVLSYHVF